MQTVKDKIENKILKASRGNLFFAEDFTNYGTPENIRQVLSRLEKENRLVRLAHGIYVKPKIDPLLGTILPTAEHIAIEIAKRDKSRIAPTGVLALNLLGLSTQVPMSAVYLTDGSQRIVKSGLPPCPHSFKKHKNKGNTKLRLPKTFGILALVFTVP